MRYKHSYKSDRRLLTADPIRGLDAIDVTGLDKHQIARLAEIRRYYSHYKTFPELSYYVGRYILDGKRAEAYEYLNSSLRGEIVFDCHNQRNNVEHLSKVLEDRKNKYRPYYEKIGIPMPKGLEDMTAEVLCYTIGVKLLSEEQLKEHQRQIQIQKDAENMETVFWGFVITILVILMIFLSQNF